MAAAVVVVVVVVPVADSAGAAAARRWPSKSYSRPGIRDASVDSNFSERLILLLLLLWDDSVPAAASFGFVVDFELVFEVDRNSEVVFGEDEALPTMWIIPERSAAVAMGLVNYGLWDRIGMSSTNELSGGFSSRSVLFCSSLVVVADVIDQLYVVEKPRPQLARKLPLVLLISRSCFVCSMKALLVNKTLLLQ